VSVISYTLALILGSFGAALVVALLFILFRGISRGFFGTRDFLKFRKSLVRLRKFDELVELERWNEAVKELERGVVFDALSSRQLVSSIKEHNQNLLSRALQVAEHYSARAESIGTVERLFLERAELQMLTIKANDAYQRIQDKRNDAGKDLPKWSQSDYLRKIKEVNEQLAINKDDLQKALANLFQEIQTPKKDEIVYH
jgi:hypothetical protein